MSKTAETFIALIRSAITGKSEKLNTCDIDYERLYRLAKFHDMAHIIYYELDKKGILPDGEVKEKLRSCYDIAVLRHLRRMNAIERLRKTLENGGVTFAFLKGVSLMALYPMEWMRTSADIDLIVTESEYDKAERLLSEDGFTFISKGTHDSFFKTEYGISIELHYTLIERDVHPAMADVLKDFWKHTQPIVNEKCERRLDDELFYYYHVAHMVKHFGYGGCGVRSFLDLWILNNKISFDRQKREALLEKGGILKFENTALQLSQMWFSSFENVSEPDKYKIMERYVLGGGALGTKENFAVLTARRKRGIKYFFSRLFLTKTEMKKRYPALHQKKYLMPVYRIKRLYTLTDSEIRTKAKAELNAEKNLDKTLLQQVDFLMNWLDIR